MTSFVDRNFDPDRWLFEAKRLGRDLEVATRIVSREKWAKTREAVHGFLAAVHEIEMNLFVDCETEGCDLAAVERAWAPNLCAECRRRLDEERALRDKEKEHGPQR